VPWIAPSHQAPALFLKLWRPRWFSGLALVLGSAVPDLEFILQVRKEWVYSHTVAAQLYFTVPAVMLLYWLATELLIPWLVPYLPGGPPFHWHDLAAVQRPRGRAWWGVAISAAIGGLSHLLLDGFTHGDRSGWLVPLVPLLRWPLPLPWGALPLYDALHPVSTVLFGVGAFAIWRRLAAGRLLWVWRGSAPRRVAEAPPAARRTLVRWLLFCTACGALAASLVSPTGSPLADVVELTAYGALDALWLGLLLAALAARFGPPLSQPLLFLDDALEG
jgi:hypothetical protein